MLSSRVGHPEFGMCCARGKVKLPPLRMPPQPLYNLFTADTRQAKDFRSNIVQYNAAFAFTFLGVKVDDSINNYYGLKNLQNGKKPSMTSRKTNFYLSLKLSFSSFSSFKNPPFLTTFLSFFTKK